MPHFEEAKKAAEEMRQGHTPEPWIIVGDRIETDSSTGLVATVAVLGMRGERQLANGRLIAAAPELLEALKQFMLLDWSKPQDAVTYNTVMANKARAIIAKAEGR